MKRIPAFLLLTLSVLCVKLAIAPKCHSSQKIGLRTVDGLNSPYSSSSAFTAQSVPAPASDEFKVLLEQSTRTSIRVVWRGASAVSGYSHRVYYYGKTLNVDAHETTIDELTATQRYSFSSANVEGDVESVRSRELIVDMTPDQNPPNVPAGLKVSLMRPGMLQVSFRGNNADMTDIQGYKIYYGADSANYSHIVNIPAESTSDSITAFVPIQENVNYYVAVSACDMPRPQSNESEKTPVVVYPGGQSEDDHDDEDNKGCLIATAVFGSENHPIVKIFRDFRDEILLEYPLGKQLVEYYYQYSPKVSEAIRDNYALKILTVVLLSPALLFCYSALRIGILWTSTLSIFLISSIVVWKCFSPKE